jgi:hypothetical protein
LADGGAQAACLRFYAGFDDVSEGEVAACAVQPELPATATHLPGQIYTGPWDTAAGSVLLEWGGTEAADENPEKGQVVLNIRLLGEVDPDDKYLVIEKVRTSAEDTPGKIKEKWDKAVEKGTVQGAIPDGFREPLPCEDEDNVEYVFDPALGRTDDNGNLTDLVTTLQGDPNNLLAEVSCLLEDDGQFELTMAHIQDAYDYADSKGLKGSLFSIGRVNNTEMNVPDVRDQNHIRREITPILLSSNAIKMGRFWVGQE